MRVGPIIIARRHTKRLLSLNDGIWVEMTAGAVEGRVRLGVPPDL